MLSSFIIHTSTIKRCCNAFQRFEIERLQEQVCHTERREMFTRTLLLLVYFSYLYGALMTTQ